MKLKLISENTETEKRNLSKLGYGVKSFTLSMIESAHHLTQGNIGSGDTADCSMGKELASPVNLLPGVVDVLSRLQAISPSTSLQKGIISINNKNS